MKTSFPCASLGSDSLVSWKVFLDETRFHFHTPALTVLDPSVNLKHSPVGKTLGFVSDGTRNSSICHVHVTSPKLKLSFHTTAHQLLVLSLSCSCNLPAYLLKHSNYRCSSINQDERNITTSTRFIVGTRTECLNWHNFNCPPLSSTVHEFSSYKVPQTLW